PHLLSYDGMEALAESMGASAAEPEQGGDAHSEAERETGRRVCGVRAGTQTAPAPLELDGVMVEGWLVHFLRDEMGRRGFKKVVGGVSGGVASAVTAFLAARAFGPENVVGVRMPYRTSSPESLEHGKLVI